MQTVLYVLDRIKTLLLLLSTLLISALFTVFREPRLALFPDNDPFTHPYFLFSNYELTKATYWYFFFWRVVIIIYALYILITATEFKNALKVFLIIHVISLLDYWLIYGEAWFNTMYFPVTWSVLQVAVFCAAIAVEVVNLTEERLQK